MAAGSLATSVVGGFPGQLRTHAARTRAAVIAGGVGSAALAYGWAQPPHGWWLLAWSIPGLLLVPIAELRLALRFAIGTLFGLLAAYATVAWSIEAALQYFDASRLAATAFMLAVWAVLVGPWFGVLAVVYPVVSRRCAPWARPLIGGWLWAGSEWLRCALGLPWCLLAHTQAMQLPVIQIAALGGAYAVSAVMAAVSIGAVQLVLMHRRAGTIEGAAVAVVLLAATIAYGRAALADEAQRAAPATRQVAVVQGNVINEFHWRRTATAHALGTYASLTGAGLQHRRADLVVWPENAVDFYLDRDALMRMPLREVAAAAQGLLLVGAPRSADDGSARNTAYLLDDRGTIRASYDKRHLLPFGEYRPWPLRSNADVAGSYQPGTTAGLISLGDTSLGTMICWDVNFPALARELVAGDARFLVHQSNDAWLDTPAHTGPAQHLAAAIFRAVETRRWIARAATTGVSGFIAATGAMEEPVPMGVAGVRQRAVPLRDDTTPYVRWGDAWLVLVGPVLLVAARRTAKDAVA